MVKTRTVSGSFDPLLFVHDQWKHPWEILPQYSVSTRSVSTKSTLPIRSVGGCQCFWGGFQFSLDWFPMHFEWISMHFGLIPSAFWMDSNCTLNGCRLFLAGFQCISKWFSMEFGRNFNWLWKEFQLIVDGCQCFWSGFQCILDRFPNPFKKHSKSIQKRHWTSIQNALKSFQKQAKPIQNAFDKTTSRRLDNIPTARPFPIGGQSLRGLMFFDYQKDRQHTED